MNASISCVTRHLHFVSASLFAIFTNQHLQNLDSSQNQRAIGVTPDPFFRHHKEKWKKAVWPRETTCVVDLQLSALTMKLTNCNTQIWVSPNPWYFQPCSNLARLLQPKISILAVTVK